MKRSEQEVLAAAAVADIVRDSRVGKLTARERDLMELAWLTGKAAGVRQCDTRMRKLMGKPPARLRRGKFRRA